MLQSHSDSQVGIFEWLQRIPLPADRAVWIHASGNEEVEVYLDALLWKSRLRGS